MRTNIDIDDRPMAEAMKADPFKTKKDAVEAGLKLLARQATYREILKWEGRLKWEGDEGIDWTAPIEADSASPRVGAREPAAPTHRRIAERAARTAGDDRAKRRRRAGR
jgi:antitoxin ParD1/3/4